MTIDLCNVEEEMRLFECGNKELILNSRILTQKPRQNIREQGSQTSSAAAGLVRLHLKRGL